MDFKSFAENVLSDLMSNVSISDILLKMKIFASKRGDKELLDWITKELDGYDDMPPKYRMLTSGCKVDVFVPFRGTARIDFPIDIIKDEKVRERLSTIPFHQPIAEIDNLGKETETDGVIKMKVPVFAYSFMSGFINGDIQDAYQYTTTAAVSQIIVAVKSVLIDYMLKISNEGEIDFSTFAKNNPKMSNTTIIAGIVNTGTGVVNAQGSTNVVGDNNAITAENKAELHRILSEIEEIAASGMPNDEYNECTADIRNELEKEKPAKHFLRRCFQAIPSFLSGVSAGVVANQLTPLIARAVGLL